MRIPNWKTWPYQIFTVPVGVASGALLTWATAEEIAATGLLLRLLALTGLACWAALPVMALCLLLDRLRGPAPRPRLRATGAALWLRRSLPARFRWSLWPGARPGLPGRPYGAGKSASHLIPLSDVTAQRVHAGLERLFLRADPASLPEETQQRYQQILDHIRGWQREQAATWGEPDIYTPFRLLAPTDPFPGDERPGLHLSPQEREELRGKYRQIQEHMKEWRRAQAARQAAEEAKPEVIDLFCETRPRAQDVIDAARLYGARAARHSTLWTSPPPVACWSKAGTRKYMHVSDLRRAILAPRRRLVLWLSSLVRRGGRAGR